MITMTEKPAYYAITRTYSGPGGIDRELPWQQRGAVIREIRAWLKANAGRNQYRSAKAAEKVRATMPESIRKWTDVAPTYLLSFG